ncbi:SMI1/KNR4 family protein [Glycomyces fuscus]|nr:SMI1/KNR4 family protein [Glycomyces fuscus]
MTELSLPPMLEDLRKTTGARDMDFEMYEAFEHPDETAWWYRLWTGNKEVDGSGFRFFGTEASGGYTGLWLVREGRTLTEQPVVFLGSEGERAVMAADVGAFLWLVAQGYGPCEAMGWSDGPCEPDPDALETARRYAPDARRDPEEILGRAREEFPDFHEYIDAQCR